MSESQSSEAANKKNIRRLRSVSAVCSLAKSWQRWVSENESKQASEPSGWCPSSNKEPDNKPCWRAAAVSKKQARPTSLPAALSPDAPVTPQPPEVGRNVPEVSRIKSKQVVKSVTSSVQEKGMGIGFLSDRYSRQPAEDVDRILNAKVSPTRRRKCSNLVSELTKGWKQVETEKRQKETHGFGGDVHSCSVDTEDSGFSELEEKSLDTEARPDTKSQTESPQKPMENRQQTEHPKDMPDKMFDSWVRIKRPSTTLVNRGVDETKKLSIQSKKYSPVGNLKTKWQNWASDHTVNQKLNPFSDEFDYELSMSTRLRKGQEGYGRPKEGSKTAERAKRAEAHIHREIDDMCFIIRTMAEPGADGRTRITFGELFDRYVRISDKVVGILMRARKHGKVAFDGEMLWQGRDDHIVITLLV